MTDRRLPPTENSPHFVLNPFADPLAFEGLAWRRIVAYGIDLMIIFILYVAFSVALGLLFPVYALTFFSIFYILLSPIGPLVALSWVALPAAYHTLTMGGAKSATLGMRAMGLQLAVWNGGKPGYLQSFMHTAVFYVTTGLTSGLILLWALFNNRRRCLHDILCGTVVHRSGRV